MRASVASFAIAAALAVGTAQSVMAQEDEPPTVSMDKIAFSPQTLTVHTGSTVTWVNGTSLHTVTADDGSFDSGYLGSGATFDVTFDTPGTYAYYCVPHGGPGGVGMAGTILVEPE